MLNADQHRQLEMLSRQLSVGNLTQMGLAMATGVHQSQISRILAGHVHRASRNVLKLCNYAESLPVLPPTQASVSEEVLTNIKALFGKSHLEDQALARLVATLGAWRQSWEINK